LPPDFDGNGAKRSSLCSFVGSFGGQPAGKVVYTPRSLKFDQQCVCAMLVCQLHSAVKCTSRGSHENQFPRLRVAINGTQSIIINFRALSLESLFKLPSTQTETRTQNSSLLNWTWTLGWEFGSGFWFRTSWRSQHRKGLPYHAQGNKSPCNKIKLEQMSSFVTSASW